MKSLIWYKNEPRRGPMACPDEKEAVSIPLKRLFVCSKSELGSCSLVAVIISGMLGMHIKALKKPDRANPIHIDIMFKSSKKGLTKHVDNPSKISAVIIVTRRSTHIGINGVRIVPIAYVTG